MKSTMSEVHSVAAAAVIISEGRIDAGVSATVTDYRLTVGIKEIVRKTYLRLNRE